MSASRTSARASPQTSFHQAGKPAATVFALNGAHTGDLIMAMPAIGYAAKKGPVIVSGIQPRFYQALIGLPVCFGSPIDEARHLTAHRTPGMHMTDVWLQTLGDAAIPTRIPFPLMGRAETNRLLPAGRWVLLSPWSDFAPKRWDPERWHLLASHIAATGLRVAVIGPPQAKELGRLIAGAKYLNLVGADTPRNWPSLMARASLVISTDSAPVHAADAMGIPVIGLYGHTQIEEFGPYWRRDLCVQANGMRQLALLDVINSFERWRLGN